MPPQGFDRLLLHTKIGTHGKIRRLPVAQRWCFVAGVLAIAAESPVRGWLFIADGLAATFHDIAHEASVSVAVAKQTIPALQRLDIVDYDQAVECWCVPDFHEWNPDPKTVRNDPTAAKRMRAYRERLAEQRDATATFALRNGSRNGDGAVTGEVEETNKEELPASGGLGETGESRPPQVEGSDPLRRAA